MANYTDHYHLHQWESTDPFLRADFNRDFAAIDAALDRVERGAENSAYNVYNLMLQNEYEDKYTGYKKALLFDGFLDGSGVSELTGGLALDRNNRRLYLDAVGQTDVDHNYGRNVGAFIDNGLSENWTAAGNGQLIGLAIYLEGTATVSILRGEEVLATDTRTGSGDSVTFGLNCAVVMGQEYQIRLTSANRIKVMRHAESGDLFGFLLYFLPSASTTGEMTSPVLDPGDWERAMAWVRHSGGTVTLALGQTAMAAGESRTVENLEGTSCLETAFTLEGGGGSFPVRLGVTTASGQSVSVYDYGVVLL